MSGILALMIGGSPSPVLPSSISVTDNSGTNAIAGLTVDSDGNLYRIQGGSTTLIARWIASGAANYEVRLTTTSGTLSSGTADTYQNAGVDRTYTVAQGSAGTKIFTGTLQIRYGTTVVASCPVTLTANFLT